jgi:hypothetical protein
MFIVNSDLAETVGCFRLVNSSCMSNIDRRINDSRKIFSSECHTADHLILFKANVSPVKQERRSRNYGCDSD